jgi:hypothetical protein
LAAGAAVAVLATARPGRAGFVVFSAGGDNTAASIQPTVDAFRAALGAPNNGNAPGPLGSGRREINWDGGGSLVASPAGTPFNGFRNIRGASFTTPGSGFLQTPLDAPELLDINPTYGTTFGVFSPARIFVPLDSTVTDTTFSIPGTGGAAPATVAGFGAVFTDVDLAGATTIELFGFGGNSLGVFDVPTGTTADGSLSFLGIVGDAGERIARVRITTGNTALGPDDDPTGGVDVVGMDDFFFSEPQAVPEPASLALAGTGLLGLAGWARRRRAAA